jgi:hypothetical protein
MDMSDKAMAERWGHVINEIPELWDALRIFEMQNRPVRAASRFVPTSAFQCRVAFLGVNFGFMLGTPGAMNNSS